jgi:hypothetical protein
MTTTGARHRKHRSLLKQHALSLTVGGILALWLVLYIRADPSTHIGAFYGNAIADWLGTFILVIATKYLFEIGSSESRQPHPRECGPLKRLLIDHSLTIVLVITGVAWVVVFARMDVNGKAGQVVGNIVSEWTQILGIVVITKYAREIGSKESRR